MADIWTKERRSAAMAGVRNKNTKPELTVRSLLHRSGYRFTINAGNNRKLPGKPDIVLPKWKTVIFVNGCFWHMHPGCKAAKIPATRTEWWKEKLEGNRKRDLENIQTLKKSGWNVVVIWSCQLKTREQISKLQEKLPGMIENV